MTRRAKFWDRIAQKYARSPIDDPESYETKLAKTRTYFTPASRVLEIGCGTGSTAIAHAPFVEHILATDVSSKMLEIAQKKANEAGVTNVTFQHVAVEDLPENDGGYDVVLGLSILHLLEDRTSTMARVHRMLKPGGVFVTSTVCIGDFLKVFRYIAPIGRAVGLLPLVRVFTEEELVAEMQAAGFEIEHRWCPGRKKALFLIGKTPG